MYTARVRIGME